VPFCDVTIEKPNQNFLLDLKSYTRKLKIEVACRQQREIPISWQSQLISRDIFVICRPPGMGLISLLYDN